ncbi:MAG TPA: alanine--tRNA ligase [Solirubrobacteraceae bacterium]|jgi:alanyl-tRNA synthetase|nr:alanine--tRNA ligase [Solirubrobacteraceae bacterium]
MTSDEIRERFLGFFAERDHLRIPSASLVPPAEDRTVLLTTAGMQPLKPCFLGRADPPAPMLTSCQKCFRTPDIDHVGSTLRHLTFFEMLGNFSIGAYFKPEAIQFAWDLSREVFSFDPDDIWVTVFSGDEQLGLGPDEEAIELWRAVGVPRERIVGCPRSENFWEAGPVGPSGPCSELYIDRGLSFGAADDLPGGENERFLEYWNLVFMQYDQNPHDRLQALPSNNIDTGLGLNRLAAILQDRDSVFDTDQFQPLIDLGQELAARRYGEDPAADRALRILSDHARGMSFLIADGVVPSNEDRGYVLRRLTRRAILQARRLHMAPGFLLRYAAVVRELMAGAYPELLDQREAIERWLASEEDAFGRTLEQGTGLLDELITRALDAGERTIAATDAFALHDTYGFPFDLTRELAGERGLGVDEQGFERLMDAQRARSRAGISGQLSFGRKLPAKLIYGDRQGAAQGAGGADPRELARELAESAGFSTRFTGYETELQSTTVGALASLAERDSDGPPANGEGAREESSRPIDGGARANGSATNGAGAGTSLLVKLAESPFYPAGGGQVSDTGTIECATGDCIGRVTNVYRLGEDQALEVSLEQGSLAPDEPVLARVDHAARRATERNHTATHLLHAALRERLGAHVRQAGSYVGPDKLRFDFTHTGALTAQELRDVQEAVNAWIAAGDPVRAISTTLQEARRLGAMALFGEKYGEVVRMIQIGDGSYSRELCGGTHVRTTAEIGVFHILGETSSAANVRRIEALTGAGAGALLREHDRLLGEIVAELRARPEDALEKVRALEREMKEWKRAGRPGDATHGKRDVEDVIDQAFEIAGATVITQSVSAIDEKALLALLDGIKAKLDGAAIVLGSASGERALFVASVPPVLVERGVKAGAIVKVAAEVAGGGGGGRDTMARAGGRYPEKVDEAVSAARAAIVQELES